MNKSKYVKWAGFALVLIVALAVSWWSMATLAMSFFGLPQWLAYAVSLAYDGAAVYTAILASEYSKTEDSGLSTRLSTLGFVGISAYLNWQHAVLLGYGLAGQVFFLMPPVVAWLLFEQFLKFENRKELRKRGRVAQSLPVYGRMAWLRFPLDTFKSTSTVIKYRLDKVTQQETGHGQEPTGQPESGQMDMDTSGHVDKPKKDTGQKKVTAKRTVTKVSTPTVQELEDSFPELTADMSIARLAQGFYKQGIESRPEIQRRVSAIKGQEVSLNTICKSVKRLAA